MIVLLLAAATWESAHPRRAVTYLILLLRALITGLFRIMDVLLPYPAVKRATVLLLRPAISPILLLAALLLGKTQASVLAPLAAAFKIHVYLQRPVTFLLLLSAQ
jgi:hypothetical protein